MERRCLLMNTYCSLIFCFLFYVYTVRTFLVLEDKKVISFIFRVDFYSRQVLNCSLSSRRNSVFLPLSFFAGVHVQ